MRYSPGKHANPPRSRTPQPASSPGFVSTATRHCSDLTRRHDGVHVARVEDLQVDRDELAQSLERLPVAGPGRLAGRGGADPRLPRTPAARGDFSYTDELGNVLWPTNNALGQGRRLRAGRPGGVSIDGADDRDPGPGGGGCRRSLPRCPTPGGERNDHVLAAMAIADVDRVFTVGGAQAIAALAYGTDTVPRVDKIVGPGGVYVTAAKRLVFGAAGIDLIAGPSEILVVADGSVDPALDGPSTCFPQAEHDSEAQAILGVARCGLSRPCSRRKSTV